MLNFKEASAEVAATIDMLERCIREQMEINHPLENVWIWQRGDRVLATTLVFRPRNSVGYQRNTLYLHVPENEEEPIKQLTKLTSVFNEMNGQGGTQIVLWWCTWYTPPRWVVMTTTTFNFNIYRVNRRLSLNRG